MDVLRALAVVAIVATVAACELEPSFHRCAVACGAGGSCPDGFSCSADDFCHSLDEFPIEGCATAGDIDAGTDPVPADASADDASTPDARVADATAVDALPGFCDLGTATNSAAVADPALFSQVVPFAGGASLPAGSYRIEYVDGCSKYAPSLWWSIHGRDSGDVSWWLVDAGSSNELIMLPGTVGLLPGTAGATGDRNGFEQFDECVAANLLIDPLIYEHSGGPLGITLADIYHADNVSGVDGRNPEWRLVYLGPCADLGA